MANETILTLVGNLVEDPNLRFTPNGAAVANFRIASTPRIYDKQANEWRDGDALFLDCAVWRQYAENVAETLRKGMQVIVQGRLKSRTYETDAGEKRTVFEIDVEDVGPTLRYATATVNRTTSGSSGGQSNANPWNSSAQPSSKNDPWGASPSKTAGDPWSQQTNTEPPF